MLPYFNEEALLKPQDLIKERGNMPFSMIITWLIMLGAVSFILGLLGEQLAQIRKTLAKRKDER